MKKNTSASRPERGQSLVEFAISLTAILILLAGAVDFGIGLFHYIAMRDAAQEGAVYGSMNPPGTGGTYSCPYSGSVTNVAEICSRLLNAAGSNGLIQNIYSDSTITVEAPTACEGNTITITFSYPYHITMPFIGAFIGSDHITLRAIVAETILTPVC